MQNNDRQDVGQQDDGPISRQNLLIGLLTLAILSFIMPTPVHSLEIAETGDRFEIESGDYRWTISKATFTVIDRASQGGVLKLEGGEASVDFLGETSSFGPPSEFLKGEDWVELRGWADQRKHLWYVARYRFFEDQPFAHLALSLMDRHEGYTTEGPWDDHWQDRILSNYNVTLRTTTDLDGHYYTQNSSFTGREVGVDPDIIVYANEGYPYHWRPDPGSDEIELIHGVTEEPDRSVGRTNSITWIPGYIGRARLTALLNPGYDYQAAEDVVYEVQHAGGVDRLLLDQTSSEVEIGSFELDRDSAVSLFTESSSIQDGVVRARALRVTPEDGPPFDITFKRLPDDVLKDNGYALGVVDLWQHHPIEVYSSGREMSVNAITEPARWMGGMGLTLDLAIVIDAERSQEAMTAIKAPPAYPSLPDWWSPFDGALAAHSDYDALIAGAYRSITDSDGLEDSFGWRGYGDYQIGISYSADDVAYQNWGGLQIDLTTGLLLGWMRSGDDRLWHRARAALRHQMDLAMAKFEPYAPKRSGHLLRKGACPKNNLITCQEPIPEFGYGYRGFLLWHHLTGEEWAKELAWQQIDALAYFGARTGDTPRSINDWLIEEGSRPGGWILKALVTGAAVFPEGTRRHDQAGEGVRLPKGTRYGKLLGELLDSFVPYINDEIGHYPSAQPVWSGQGIEGLAMAYLQPGNAYRTEALKRAIIASCEDLVASMDWGIDGYTFVYDREDGDVEWTDELNYGWLWLSPLAACAEIEGQGRFADAADDLFEANLSYYSSTDEVSIRQWSSLLGFGGYYLAKKGGGA